MDIHSILHSYPILFFGLVFFIGLFSGFVDSIAGGGGLFSVPSFLFLGIPPTNAIAQAKATSVCGTLVSLKNYLKSKHILLKLALYGIPPALLGSYIGAYILTHMDNNVVGKIITFMMPIGIILFLIPKNKTIKTRELTNFDYKVLVPIICLTIGFYDGFFGPGTGSFSILALHYILKLDLVKSSANAKTFNLSSNISALVIFILAKKIIWHIAIFSMVGNAIGGYIGSHMAIKKGDKFIKKILTFSLIALCITLFAKYL